MPQNIFFIVKYVKKDTEIEEKEKKGVLKLPLKFFHKMNSHLKWKK